jgi:succinoglycan biosynthesis transport protein ExoP
MRPQAENMTLRDYGRVVVRRRWLIVVAVLSAVFVALLVAFVTDPIYESEAEMHVRIHEDVSPFDRTSATPGRDEERAIDTEIQVLEGDTVRSRVQEQLGLPQLPPPVDGTSIGQTDVVSVAVRSSDRRTAQVLADAYVQAYISLRRDEGVERVRVASSAVEDQITNLQAEIDQLSEFDPRRQALVLQQASFEEALSELHVDAAIMSGGATLVAPADLPSDPAEPQPVRTVALAAVAGLLVGLAAAFLVDHLDDSVESSTDLEMLSRVPTLATVPMSDRRGQAPLAIRHPHDHAVEIYRGLRTSVQILALDRPIRTIQVTSALAGEGKSTVASNVAVVLAQSGKRVVVVDADQRHPTLHAVFERPQEPGLTELVLGSPVDDVVHRIELEGPATLDLVTAGSLSPQPSDTLSSQATLDVLNTLKLRYDYLILDSAPVLSVTDAVATAPNVDAVMMVVASGTAGRALADALSRLDQVAAPVVGLVLNKATAPQSSSHYYSRYAEAAGASAR